MGCWCGKLHSSIPKKNYGNFFINLPSSQIPPWCLDVFSSYLVSWSGPAKSWMHVRSNFDPYQNRVNGAICSCNSLLLEEIPTDPWCREYAIVKAYSVVLLTNAILGKQCNRKSIGHTSGCHFSNRVWLHEVSNTMYIIGFWIHNIWMNLSLRN